MARTISFRFDAISGEAVAAISKVASSLGAVTVSSNEAAGGMTRAGAAEKTLAASSNTLAVQAKAMALSVTEAAKAQVAAEVTKTNALRETIVYAKAQASAVVKGSEEQIQWNRLAAESAGQLALAYKTAGDSAVLASRKAVAGAKEQAAAERSATGRTALRGRGAGGITAGLVGVGPGVLAGAAATLGAISTLGKAGGFQQQLNILQQAGEATTKQLAAAREEAKALGRDLTLPATSAKDAAEAMTELAKAGLEVDQAIAAGKGTLQLAAAANLAAADAAKIEASALNAFELSGTNATKVADQLAAAANAAQGEISDMAYGLQQSATVAHQFGLTTGETITALTALAKAGIVGSDAGTSLRTMLQRLVPNTQKARDLLKSLHIEVADGNGKFFSITKIIGQYHDALVKLNPQAKQQALFTLFGADAQRAANVVLGTGAKRFTELQRQVEKQGAAAETAAARNKGYLGALDAFKSAIETLQISIGEQLLPTFTEAFRQAGAWVNRMEESGKAADAAKQGLDIVVQAFNVAKTVIGQAAQVVGVLVDTVGGAKNALILLAAAWAVSKVFAFGKAIMAARVALIATGRASAIAAGEYKASMTAMQLATIGLKTTIRSALITTGIGALIVAAGFAAEYVITHWEKVKGWVKEFGRYLKVTFDVAFEAVKQAAKAAVYVVLQQVTAVFRGILELASYLPFIGDKAKDALNSINSFIDRWKPEFGKVAEEAGRYAGTQMANAFTDAYTKNVKAAITAGTQAAAQQASGTAAAESPGRAAAPKGASKVTGATIAVPSGFKSTHDTAGLKGFPAVDVFAQPGTQVLAPEDGDLEDPHFIQWDTGRRVGGWTIYFQGHDTGDTYFMTHFSSVGKPGFYSKGSVIGIVAQVPGQAWQPHIHVGQHKGKYSPPTSTGGGVTIPVVGTGNLPGAGAGAGKGTSTGKATRADRTQLRVEVEQMQRALAQAFTIRPSDRQQTEQQLRGHVIVILAQLAKVSKAIRGATSEADVKVLQARLGKIKDDYTKTLDGIKSLIESKRASLVDAMTKTADFMLQAFDRVTQKALDKINAGFDQQIAALQKAGAELTPSEQSIRAEQVTRENAEQLAAIDAAQKALAAGRAANASPTRIAELQKAVDDALAAQRTARLENQAEQERAQRDKDTSDKIAAIEKERSAAMQAAQDAAAAQRQAFQDGLDALNTSLAEGRVSWTEYSKDIRKLMRKYGLDPDWWSAQGHQVGTALGAGLTAPFLKAWRAAIAEIKADLAGLTKTAAPSPNDSKKDTGKKVKKGRTLATVDAAETPVTTTVAAPTRTLATAAPAANEAPQATKTPQTTTTVATEEAAPPVPATAATVDVRQPIRLLRTITTVGTFQQLLDRVPVPAVATAMVKQTVELLRTLVVRGDLDALLTAATKTTRPRDETVSQRVVFTRQLVDQSRSFVRLFTQATTALPAVEDKTVAQQVTLDRQLVQPDPRVILAHISAIPATVAAAAISQDVELRRTLHDLVPVRDLLATITTPPTSLPTHHLTQQIDLERTFATNGDLKAKLLELANVPALNLDKTIRQNIRLERSIDDSTVAPDELLVTRRQPSPDSASPYATRTQTIHVTIPNAVFLSGDRQAARELARTLEPELSRRIVGFQTDV